MILNYKKQILIIFWIIISVLPSLGQFAGGTGTADDPYLIETAEQLNNIRQFLGASYTDLYYKQIANIELGVAPWNLETGWEPIGFETLGDTYFLGNYDGNGFYINGLYINRPEGFHQALFGFIKEAQVINVRLTNVYIIGNEYVGGLVGLAWFDSSIENCSVTGIITGNWDVGGLLGGIDYSSSINKCFSDVSIVGDEYVGGLVGSVGYAGGNNEESKIIESFSLGSVSGGLYVGGLTGSLYYGSNILNCFSKSEVYGENTVGGLVGDCIESSIRFCYSTGSVSQVEKCGGLIGSSYNSLIKNSLWDVETSGLDVSQGGIGKTTLEMKDINSFTNEAWDFKWLGVEGIWNIRSDLFSGTPFNKWSYIHVSGYTVQLPLMHLLIHLILLMKVLLKYLLP